MEKQCRMYLVFDEAHDHNYCVNALNATEAIAMVQGYLGTESGSAAAIIATPHSIYIVTDCISEGDKQ